MATNVKITGILISLIIYETIYSNIRTAAKNPLPWVWPRWVIILDQYNGIAIH